MKKLKQNFFTEDAFEVAANLIGQYLVRDISGNIKKYQITELEIYYGEEDSASHARFGKTKRSKIMYEVGGTIYVYLIYGIHHLFNIVTGPKDKPQAILIRGIEGFNGPGKLTKELNIDIDLNGQNLNDTNKIWFESDNKKHPYKKYPRVGIDYATEPYKSIKWRFVLDK